MRVQLRVLRTAHAMAIGRRHEPLPHLAPHATAAATHSTRLALQVAQGRTHGRLVRVEQRAGNARCRAPRRVRRFVNVVPAQAAARLLNGGAPVVEAAVDDLVNDGLAERDGAQVRASTAAWRFDALWPARA